MPKAKESRNKAAFQSFVHAANSVESERSDQVFEPDALIRMPVPTQATGAAAITQVFTGLLSRTA